MMSFSKFELKDFQDGCDQLPQPSDDDNLIVFEWIGQFEFFVIPQNFEIFIPIFFQHFSFQQINAFPKIQNRFLIFFNFEITISNILIQKTAIISYFLKEFNSLSILHNFISTLSSKIIFWCVFEESVYYFNFLIYFDYILSSFIFGYLDSCITIWYEFASLV